MMAVQSGNHVSAELNRNRNDFMMLFLLYLKKDKKSNRLAYGIFHPSMNLGAGASPVRAGRGGAAVGTPGETGRCMVPLFREIHQATFFLAFEKGPNLGLKAR